MSPRPENLPPPRPMGTPEDYRRHVLRRPAQVPPKLQSDEELLDRAVAGDEGGKSELRVRWRRARRRAASRDRRPLLSVGPSP